MRDAVIAEAADTHREEERWAVGGASGRPVRPRHRSDDRPAVRLLAAVELVHRRQFQPEGGVITAANASQTADGAAALLMTTSETAAELAMTPIARMHTAVLAGAAPVMMLKENGLRYGPQTIVKAAARPTRRSWNSEPQAHIDGKRSDAR